MSSTLPYPGAWAETVLRALLPPETRESVSGDLLEEYRDEQLPRRGLFRARLWYLRQVAAVFWRTAWPCVLMLVAMLVFSDLSNTFRDSNGAEYVATTRTLWPMLPLALGLTGLYGGWRTRTTRGGITIAVGGHVITWTLMALWWTTTFYPFAMVQQTNPYWIQAWHYSSASGESFAHWIFWDNVGAIVLGGTMMLALSAVLGGIGGTLGRCIAPSRDGASGGR